ncbi:ankyrin repeat-containing domain protein [Corynascus similis CBS 632.67]
MPYDKEDQLAVINLLLSHGADAYASYPDGRFVFQAIVEERGDPSTVITDLIHALLNIAADPLATDNEGRTPQHWLCAFSGRSDETYREAFAALTCHGSAAITKTDKQGRTPLHLALVTYSTRSQQSPFAIQHLLSVGADPADPDPVTGNSALHFIAPRLVGEATAAAEATALFCSLTSGVDINRQNAAGEAPVFVFAAAGWEATLDPKNKLPSPKYALEHDVTHAALLEAVFADPALGVDLVDATDACGRTLFHVTAGRDLSAWLSDTTSWDVQTKSVEGAFKKLLELGLDPRREDNELRTAIDIAVAKDLKGIVMLFSEEAKRSEEEEERTGM